MIPASDVKLEPTEILFLKQMSAEGHDVARLTLARRYMEGKRVPQSDFLAFRYLRELTNNSDPVVHRMMGEILTRDKGVPPNPAQAHRHFRASWRLYQALLKWNPMSITLTRLGSIYENGLGVERDLEIAGRYYHDSAMRGEIEGTWKLVEFRAKGIFADSDPDEGTTWRGQLHFIFTEAERGDLALQYKLGQLFSMNRIIPPDHVQSAYWFGKASEGRLIDAYLPMGEHYEFGLGVELNAAKALELYQEAARVVGDEKARYRAAALLLNRNPSEENLEKVSELLFEGEWERHTLGRLLATWAGEEL